MGWKWPEAVPSLRVDTTLDWATLRSWGGGEGRMERRQEGREGEGRRGTEGRERGGRGGTEGRDGGEGRRGQEGRERGGRGRMEGAGGEGGTGGEGGEGGRGRGGRVHIVDTRREYTNKMFQNNIGLWFPGFYMIYVSLKGVMKKNEESKLSKMSAVKVISALEGFNTMGKFINYSVTSNV